jgi:hypothetical protein
MKMTQVQFWKALQKIRRMERGSLCAMRKGTSGTPYYNHQTWENGRNRVRYVPAAQVATLREAIAGYTRFMRLIEAYAADRIRETRRELKEESASMRKAGGAEGKPSRPPPSGARQGKGRSRAREARRRAAPPAGGRA